MPKFLTKRCHVCRDPKKIRKSTWKIRARLIREEKLDRTMLVCGFCSSGRGIMEKPGRFIAAVAEHAAANKETVRAEGGS